MSQAPSLKFIFDRRNKASNTQAETLYFEVMHKRIRRYINSGIKLCKHQWNAGSQTIVNHRDADSLNQKLEHMRRTLRDLMQEHCLSPMGFDLDEYMSIALSEREAISRDFLEFARERSYARGLQGSTLRQHHAAFDASKPSVTFAPSKS